MILRSVAVVALTSTACVVPPKSPAPPASLEPAVSTETPTSTSTAKLDPAKVYAQHLQRAGRLQERCELGAVDLEAFTDTAAYLLEFQSHPIRDAALAGLEICRQLIVDEADRLLSSQRPDWIVRVAELLGESVREGLTQADVEAEVRVEQDGASVTVEVEAPSEAGAVIAADTFEFLCVFAGSYAVETLVLIDNGERRECSPPPDVAWLKERILQEMEAGPPLDPPPAGDRPVPIE